MEWKTETIGQVQYFIIGNHIISADTVESISVVDSAIGVTSKGNSSYFPIDFGSNENAQKEFDKLVFSLTKLKNYG